MNLLRLDYLVANKMTVSRSVAVNLIESGKVRVNNSLVIKPAQKFNPESEIEVEELPLVETPEIDFKILYEDQDCVVIDKPSGILVHSKGLFNSENTVASWLFPHTDGFDKNNNRAGIVHRLDRATSGVMICAKNPSALKHFQKQFSSRNVKKTYYALIEGKIEPEEALVDIPIERNPKDPKRFKTSANGKSAKTKYKVEKVFMTNDNKYSLISLSPYTGRTHQLRVHLNYLKKPIVGDDFYGGIKADRLYLHAYSLEITLSKGRREVFTAKLPDSFKKPGVL